MNPFKRKKIGEILVERGELNPSYLSFALAIIKTTGERFGKVCLVNALISEEALARALAEQFGMEYVDLTGFKLDEAILDIFPHVLPSEAIYRYRFVPIGPCGESLVLAVDDPTDIIKLDELEYFLDRPIIFKVATESAIESVLRTEAEKGPDLKDVPEDHSTVRTCGFKIPVASFEKSVYFYRDFLGLCILKQSRDEVVFAQGLVLVPSAYTACFPEGFNLRSLVHVHLSNIEEHFARAVKQNIRIISKLVPWGRSGSSCFRCLDPDGNIVEVFSSGNI